MREFACEIIAAGKVDARSGIEFVPARETWLLHHVPGRRLELIGTARRHGP